MSTCHDQNNATSSQSLISPPLPTLPFHIIEEILCRLPVNLLLQLKCISKSCNSLISDPKFAKKHLSLSTTRHLYFINIISQEKFMLTSYPINSICTTMSTNDATQLEYLPKNYDGYHIRSYSDYIVGSCNGILCIASVYGDSDDGFILLWNPSIRKFKKLPPINKPCPLANYQINTNYTFCYDHVTDTYKVVVVFYRFGGERLCDGYKTEVQIHTLGINFWKKIQEFPFGVLPFDRSGYFVSGTINWLASKEIVNTPCFIVSLDLENESYQEIWQPDYGDQVDVNTLDLSVLRDCLCMLSGHADVWIMKEYGNKESWIKLFTVSYMRDPSKCYSLDKAIYILEDDQVLFEYSSNRGERLIVYDPRMFKFIKFLNKSDYRPTNGSPDVCVESLISPLI